MKRFILVVMITIGGISAANAQKEVTDVQQFWTAYFNQTRFTERWGLWADAHLRSREDFVQGLSTFIGRVGLTYHVNPNLRFTAGYGFINHFPADGREISQPEHRPWQQVQWNDGGERFRLSHTLRLEERFRRKIRNGDELAEGHNFNYRWRYNLLWMVPLNKKAFAPGTLSLALNDEIHINMGKEIRYNYFDQNRFFAGLAYHVDANNTVQFGYSNIFVQQASGDSYRNIHAARIFYFHNVDLRKRQRN